MTATHHLPPNAEHKIPASLAVIALSASLLGAETPKLNIRTKNGLPMEEQRKEQMLRLAREYDDDLQRTFPGPDYHVPEGVKSSYFHIAVCMLEWQAMEELVGAERARKVMEWKQRDHYNAIYALILEQREQVERVLNRNGVRW